MTDRTPDRFATDRIHIRGLRLRTRIGVADWEKKDRQDIVIELTLHSDQRKAAASDAIADTVDYKAVRDDVVAFVESSQHELLEALAHNVADRVLAFDGVTAVDVTIDKPLALRFADSVAVSIHRRRGRGGSIEEA